MYSRRIINYYSSIKKYTKKTPLELSDRLSKKHNCNVFLKREDIQITRSFKIRGATNKIINNIDLAREYGVVCVSAGNHAQGFSHLCNEFNLNGTVFIPNNTPLQKKNRIEFFGGDNISIKQHGMNFNECLEKALKFKEETNTLFIHPFNDHEIIDGQATIAHEIYQELLPNYIMCCVGGGGLISGILQYSKEYNPQCKVVGVEPYGAASLTQALENGSPKKLDKIDTFVDGGSVAEIGNLTFDIINNTIDGIHTTHNEELANIMIEFYEYEGIILEPAGALSVSALSKYNFESNDNVVCILSGGNNDITRYQEIMDLNLRYLNKKHYFIIQFAQKPGQLTNFMKILDKNDDITRFEYIKKTNKNYGDVLICIETENISQFINKMNVSEFNYKQINPDDLIYNYLV